MLNSLSRFLGWGGYSRKRVTLRGRQDASTRAQLAAQQREANNRDQLAQIIQLANSGTPVTSSQAIPFSGEVLSCELGVMDVGSQHYQDAAIAALNEHDPKNILLVISESLRNRPYHHQLMATASKLSYNVVGEILAVPSVIRKINEDGARIVENRRRTSERQESATQKRWLNLVQEAVEKGASDMHFELSGDAAEVRFRVNGELSHHSEMSKSDLLELMRVAYQVQAKVKGTSFSPHAFLDAAIEETIGNIRVALRFASYPTDNGSDYVLRVLPMGRTSKKNSLEALGYNASQLHMLDLMQSTPNGVIVLCGTTGSGKSTTIKIMISNIIREAEGRIKVITIEDPVEYSIEGASQIPVTRKQNDEGGPSPFATAMRTAMRSDPDILMVGEVRDEESVQLLERMVNSGHRVFTTTHTSSVLGVPGRLTSLGISRHTLGAEDFLSGLIYQRLVGVACPHCRVPFFGHEGNRSDVEEWIRLLIPHEFHGQLTAVRRGGCTYCNGTGITDRTVCAEMMLPTPEILQAIQLGQDWEARKLFRGMRNPDDPNNMNGRSALEHALLKARTGEISPNSIVDEFGRKALWDFLELQKPFLRRVA